MPDVSPTIFFSYSQKDQNYLDELLEAVKPAFGNRFDIDVWSDQQIASGDPWKKKIEAALAGARAAVLLISNAFLNSEYILKKELPALLPRVGRDDFRLYTLLVSAVAKPALRITIPSGGGSEDEYDLSEIQAEHKLDHPLEKMSRAERNELFAGLAGKLFEFTKGLRSTTAPQGGKRPRMFRASGRGRTPDETRPELMIQLKRNGSDLERYLFLHGQQRPVSPELHAPDALERLQFWQPGQDFDGDLLFELLFGNDPAVYRDILASPYGEVDPGGVEPTRYPWRLRLFIEAADRELQCLPWTRISHLGIPLSLSGWTLEFSPQPTPYSRPEFANHAFIMPGRVLLVFPETEKDPVASAHLRDVRSRIQQFWTRPLPIFEAAGAGELKACLRDYSPRLVYFYGRVEKRDGQWRLLLGSGSGTRGVGFDELKRMFSSVPPSAMFFNLLGEEAVEAMPDTAILSLDPACKLVAMQATPRSQEALAQQSAMDWIEWVLSDDKRFDPVWALHDNGHAFAACRTAYQLWAPQLGESHLDDDLVQLLLDRTPQRRHLLQARDDFFDLSANLRVQCFLAAGVWGNRVEDFPQQAETHLQVHQKKGAHVYLCPVKKVPTSVTDTARLDTLFRRRFGLKPSSSLFDALRPRQSRRSNEYLVPVLAWTLAEDATKEQRAQIAGVILEWSRERLSINCPDDLRIISLLAIETGSEEEFDDLRRGMEQFDEKLTDGVEYRRTTSFRFEVLDRLSSVTRKDLRHYFDSEYCTCPDGLRRDYPLLLLQGRREISFEEAVGLIRAARDQGWVARKAQLEKEAKARAD